jgi:hypothetical protein
MKNSSKAVEPQKRWRTTVNLKKNSKAGEQQSSCRKTVKL